MNLLFVCTGNICRSPMAEALAAALGQDVTAASAGTNTVDGSRASDHSATVMQELGIDLTGHRSRTLATALAAGPTPDRVYVMEPAHAEVVRSRFPDLAQVVELLEPEGTGIADPYGLDLATYRRTRDAIRSAIRHRSVTWR